MATTHVLRASCTLVYNIHAAGNFKHRKRAVSHEHVSCLGERNILYVRSRRRHGLFSLSKLVPLEPRRPDRWPSPRVLPPERLVLEARSAPPCLRSVPLSPENDKSSSKMTGGRNWVFISSQRDTPQYTWPGSCNATAVQQRKAYVKMKNKDNRSWQRRESTVLPAVRLVLSRIPKTSAEWVRRISRQRALDCHFTRFRLKAMHNASPTSATSHIRTVQSTDCCHCVQQKHEEERSLSHI